ncbi:outer membrane beta-barrel family protein [Chitinophaga niabensis]|uniref:Outer membrane receptor proteins, mostly Fe transport n=1 Tax=Chitinophaga niabensis TaxID=536979 RepID=A0A1N6EL72_9BACT|nr:outer membrane beta-barrel family protein [Chitinophaga niabensis]SIN83707.1 Outer membrane receptor proteins, mostly Fe transport [Chitinophaga niabensis]
MRKIVILLLGWVLCMNSEAFAQRQQQGELHAELMGKLLDDQTGKPVEYASVALLNASDSALVTGMLSKGNGDFSFSPVKPGSYILKIYFIGYQTFFKAVTVKTVSDVGNIRLKTTARNLKGVEVVGEKPAFTMAIDKRVFNVDKNLASVGGTATDVLRQVPSVNVDIDGNVSVRNGSPTIFIDGRPSTLTLDQIPADAIANIEVVTNPSAKYDAEGMSGILNIVLKKNRRAGINGLITGGYSTTKSSNAGIDLNIRQDKINFFVNYNLRDRKSPMKQHLFRKNFDGADTTFLDQYQDGDFGRRFQSGRIGFDWFIDNRNTLTLSQGIVGGDFNNLNEQTTYDLDAHQTRLRYGLGRNDSKNNFRNYTSQIGYKRTFAKEGMELTGDFTYNRSTGKNNNDYSLQYYDMQGQPSNSPNQPELRQGRGNSSTTYYTGQIDFVNPLSERSKLEAGLRTNVRTFNSLLNTLGKNFNTGAFEYDSALSNNYHYSEQINAAYVSYTGGTGNFGYQTGLRAEQSYYSGEMRNVKDANYKIDYPISLFPSVFLTQKFKGDHELQLNYSRRIQRPWFRDLLPNIQYNANSANRGNPALKPEFTNSFELSYLKDFAKKHNVLISVYYRNTNNAITNFYVDTTLNLDGQERKVVLNYPINADQRNSFGAELTVRNQITKSWDITTNLNASQTKISANNLNNSGFVWFGKVNSNTKLPWNLTLQVTGEYESRQILPQGEDAPEYQVDLAMKKDFFKKKNFSVALGLTDIFNTDRDLSWTNTSFSSSERYRKRVSRELRLNLSWRFGKMDTKLFSKKGKREGGEGGDMGGDGF